MISFVLHLVQEFPYLSPFLGGLPFRTCDMQQLTITKNNMYSGHPCPRFTTRCLPPRDNSTTTISATTVREWLQGAPKFKHFRRGHTGLKRPRPEATSKGSASSSHRMARCGALSPIFRTKGFVRVPVIPQDLTIPLPDFMFEYLRNWSSAWNSKTST